MHKISDQDRLILTPFINSLDEIKRQGIPLSILDKLQPPELLCATEIRGLIGDYSNRTLTADDPLFIRIRKVLQEIEVFAGALQDEQVSSLKNVQVIYKKFIEEVCQTRGEDRVYVLKGGGDTPLHFAAKHGDVENVALLIERGADTECPNLNNDTPFDLALKYRQDEVAHLFLGIKKQPENETPPSGDPERYYYELLVQAKEADLLEEQILTLEKLSEYYLKKKDYIKASQLLNSALALVTEKPLFKRYFLTKLERIEELFFENEKITNSKNTKGMILHYRRLLTAYRENCRTLHLQKNHIHTVLKTLTQAFKSLIKSLVTAGQEILGPSPVEWACIGLGSMARDEMCPFSDLEFAFLIEQATPEALNYFRRLTKVLELKIIHMGETAFPIFRDKDPSLTPNGFCLDIGGNTPYGNRDTYELIGTPLQLARFQKQEWIDENIILPNAMGTVCLIAGNVSLMESYQKEKSAILNNKASFLAPSHRKIFALDLLAGHINLFFPNLSVEKEKKDKAFGIKKELYRPFQEIISSVALFYNLKATNTLDRVRELIKMNVFCPKGGEHIQKAISQVLCLRFEAHLFYQDEKEFLCHKEEGIPQEKQLLYLDAERTAMLHEVYKVLIPFCNSFKEFSESKGKKSVNKCIFYDEGLLVQGIAFEKTFHYQDAKNALQQSVSVNPNDIDSLRRLGSVEGQLGNTEECLKRAYQTLEIAQKMFTPQHGTFIIIHNNIAVALSLLGKFDDALEHLQNAAQIFLKNGLKKDPRLAPIYLNIGSIFHDKSKDLEAMDYYRKALSILSKNSIVDLELAGTLSLSIGQIFASHGESAEALEYFKNALKYHSDRGFERNPSIALIYGLMADSLYQQEKYAEALVYGEKALQIYLLIYGEQHRTVVASYLDNAIYLIHLGKQQEAGLLQEKAFQLFKKVYSDDHPQVGHIYIRMGSYFEGLEYSEAALEYYEKALQIFLKSLGEQHSDVAISYNKIGSHFSSKGNEVAALEYFQKALQIYQNIYGEQYPLVAASYFKIGTSLNRQKKHPEDMEHFQKALQIIKNIYGDQHSNIATIYCGIGICLNSQRKYTNALEYFQKALLICVKKYGEQHPRTAEIYNQIGLTIYFGNLGEDDAPLAYHKKALQIYLKIYGEQHLLVAETRELMRVVLATLG